MYCQLCPVCEEELYVWLQGYNSEILQSLDGVGCRKTLFTQATIASPTVSGGEQRCHDEYTLTSPSPI